MQQVPSPATKPELSRWVLPAILSASAAFLYLQVFILPNVPRIANGDQGIYLLHAARMLDGDLIYRDYDHFTFPGTDVLYLALFKLFGVRAWIAPAMLIVVGTTITGLSIHISRKLMTGTVSLLPGLLFLTLPFSGYLDATHHWYSALLATAALALVIEKRTPIRVLGSGALWGLATCFTQTVVLGGGALGLFLVWESRNQGWPGKTLLWKELCLFAGLIGTVAAFNAYFVWQVGLKQFWYYTVVFLAKYYSADSFNQWSVYMTNRPSIRIWSQLPNFITFALIHFLLPLIYVLFLVRYYRESKSLPEEPWDRLMLVNLTGLALFIGVLHSAAYMRLYAVSLPALILLCWFLKYPFRVERVMLRTLWAAIIVVAIARPAITQTLWNQSLDLPTGRTAFPGYPLLYDKCKWMSERTQPGDYFLNDPQICFSLRLHEASRVAFLRPTDYTRPEEVQDAVQSLEKHQVRFVEWNEELDNGIESPGNHLAPLRIYIRTHYHIVKTFFNADTIWEQNKSSD